MDLDDYFPDDLDDDALFLLDQEEAKFAATQARRLTPPPSPPPAKRQKVSHIKQQVDIVDDEKPEIRLGVNGRYIVLGAHTSPINKQNLGTAAHTSNRVQPAQRIEKTTDPPKGNPKLKATKILDSVQRPPPPTPNETRAVPRSLTVPKSQTVIPSSTQSSLNIDSRRNDRDKASKDTADLSKGNNMDLVLLQSEVEQLKRDQATLEDVLRSERNQRYAKEGEVAILRKSIEKTQIDHAAYVTQLQASREAAEAKQAQIQKQMKEEMERLRTEFTFKKHELENTVYRGSGATSRIRRTSTGNMNSPVPVPEAMKSWNPRANSGWASNSQIPATQRRTSPHKAMATAEPNFPGFENSFLQSSPIKSPTARKSRPRAPVKTRQDNLSVSPSKGKQRAVDREMLLTSPTKNRFMSFSQFAGADAQGIDEDIDMDEDISYNSSRDRSTFLEKLVEAKNVDDLSPVAESKNTEPLFDSDAILSIDWRYELHSLLLTHTCTKSSTYSLQLLLSVTFPDGVPNDIMSGYQMNCASLLEAMGTWYSSDIMGTCAFPITRPMVKMAQFLLAAGQLQALTCILDLIYTLMICIPSFLTSLLRTILGDQSQDASPFVTLLCDIIAAHMQPSQVNEPTDGSSRERHLELGRSVLKLIELLSWSTGKEDVPLLATIIRDGRVFCRLLDRKQPSEFCISVLRILVMLSAHGALCQPIVEAKDTADPDRPDPILNRLAKLLLDKRPMLPDVHEEADQLIIKFFGLLSIADPSGHSAVLDCSQALPAMVLHLQVLTSSIYEDEEHSIFPEKALPLLHATRELVHLLHFLMFSKLVDESSEAEGVTSRRHKGLSKEPSINLYSKLSMAPPIPYNGSVHVFITAISRLSYADPPEWLTEEGRTMLEDMCEIARELLELVLQGADCDSVWDAFQGGNDDGDEPDTTNKPEDVEMIDDLLDEMV